MYHVYEKLKSGYRYLYDWNQWELDRFIRELLTWFHFRPNNAWKYLINWNRLVSILKDNELLTSTLNFITMFSRESTKTKEDKRNEGIKKEGL